ncbi:MAG: hypothetical protein GY833_24755 [Aestuariibacter sp.]|nr:hypothetical protein [Aestuariibacter sp.]
MTYRVVGSRAIVVSRVARQAAVGIAAPIHSHRRDLRPPAGSVRRALDLEAIFAGAPPFFAVGIVEGDRAPPRHFRPSSGWSSRDDHCAGIVLHHLGPSQRAAVRCFEAQNPRTKQERESLARPPRSFVIFVIQPAAAS